MSFKEEALRLGIGQQRLAQARPRRDQQIGNLSALYQLPVFQQRRMIAEAFHQ